MQARLNPYVAAPAAMQPIAALDTYVVKHSGLAVHLVHLLKIRASQINGCAYCVDMHTREARHDGLGEQWINLIATWQESPVYTPQERAVLGWTEALTLLPQSRASDADFEPLRAHFSDAEITALSVAIAAINVWNRIAVGFRTPHPVDPQAA
ncbi:alkylhydroperoxidase [Devosia limi DSM 17137]|uniref:Alkylhydroperoxidase n=1 Tax=Devosia limi DSM 17137 TaxID=1121477 RepID=A0A0F5L2C2_9HYPH|nr:carboxymuconolactone decarboxylase family protein [Devosia limi]KKB76360.1 alkylhydroperoxidase [Devosia limi DSM 17137]SHF71995.1 alkylhydroperoxidase AhpD family core domain-containing protein [Devosia limi DSM 17137]